MMKTTTMLTGGVYGEKTGRNPAVYLCCEYCDRPMTKSWICLWQEDAEGKPHNVTLLHYHCREEFEIEHKGKWLSRGWPVVKINCS
jgi:hypothetical protein